MMLQNFASFSTYNAAKHINKQITAASKKSKKILVIKTLCSFYIKHEKHGDHGRI